MAVETPESATAVAEVIARARGTGVGVTAAGAGHSFSAVAAADGIQLDMSALAGLISVDAASMRATIGAGTRLADIPAMLDPHGLAMANLGDIDRQTLAGALSTGTHGTGLGFGSISTQVAGVTMVTGAGEMLTVSATERPELLPFVRLGIGALGVIVDVTVQCVPAFALRATEAPEPLADVLDGWTDRVRGHDHFELYWFPHTSMAQTKANERVDPSERAPLGRVRRFVDDELLANGVYEVACRAGSMMPAVVPSIARMSSAVMGHRTFTDRSDRVFVSSRSVRFREMEYGMPVDAVPSVLSELRAVIEREGWRISFPVEARTAAADDVALSTANGRDTGYVAVHRYWREDPRAYFEAAERIFLAHDGRPHWGKLHSLGSEQLAARVPGFDAFVAARDALDPDRVMQNRYSRRVLGA